MFLFFFFFFKRVYQIFIVVWFLPRSVRTDRGRGRDGERKRAGYQDRKRGEAFRSNGFIDEDILLLSGSQQCEFQSLSPKKLDTSNSFVMFVFPNVLFAILL